LESGALFWGVFCSTAVERRRGKRYLLRLACRVTSPDERFAEIQGTTTDISRTGVRVVFKDMAAVPTLCIGETACVLMDLPQSPYFTPRLLECIGRVVRVGDTDPGGTAVAFEIIRTRVRERDGQVVEGDPTASLLQ
jgi:PilZ domain